MSMAPRRDFFSLVVITVCMENITCNCVKFPDQVETVISAPLQKDARGVYIRQGKGDIETSADSFKHTDPCHFAEEAADWIHKNAVPGEVQG